MIKPLLDRILVKCVEKQDTTKSGIILKNNENSKTKIGKVLEVGEGGDDGEKQRKMYIKKGDNIIITKFSGTEIEYEGENLLIVKQDEVLAILE